jgi:predicted RNA-binding Zn-ribbon protein involved in translation (DUF1610 family)
MYNPRQDQGAASEGTGESHCSAPSLRREIQDALNRYSAENGCNTPDFILAEFLTGCLAVFDSAVNQRERWYGRQRADQKWWPNRDVPNSGVSGGAASPYTARSVGPACPHCGSTSIGMSFKSRLNWKEKKQ